MTINWEYVAWTCAAFVVSVAVSFIVVAVVVIKIPPTYFLDRPRRQLWIDQHPAVRCALLFGKNVLGLGIVVAGTLLSLPGIPGQGILTILMGLLLVDFPGKRTLERKIVGRPRILGTINAIRRRFHKAPLRLEES